MKKLYVADRQTGTTIEEITSVEVGIELIKGYEEMDKANDCYEENFYEVVMDGIEEGRVETVWSPVHGWMKDWYAVQTSSDDDWGTGSYSLEEAIEMAKQIEGATMIAVIEMGEDPVCVDELRNGIELEW